MQFNSSVRPTGLSVVIPTLNRVEMVSRACQSVASAQPDRVEIIVIDDGSTEDLRPLLPANNNHNIPIRCYRFERNRGPQAARNLGIRRARFSHIAFLDSDDSFTQDKIDLVLQQLDSTPVDLLFHDVQGMPKYGKLARLWAHSLSRWITFSWWIALLNPVITPALVVRRERRLGLVRLRYCEDWCFLLHYVQSDTRIRFLERELSIVYRPAGTSGGLSGAIWRMRKGEFTARRVLLKSSWPSGFLRYCLGGMAGLLRILSDVLRGRYLH